MNFFKFISSSLVATTFSIIISLVSLVFLWFVVRIFKLNYGKDAYWVFNVVFVVFIISWIVLFGIFMSPPEEQRKMPSGPPPSLKSLQIKSK